MDYSVRNNIILREVYMGRKKYMHYYKVSFNNILGVIILTLSSGATSLLEFVDRHYNLGVYNLLKGRISTSETEVISVSFVLLLIVFIALIHILSHYIGTKKVEYVVMACCAISIALNLFLVYDKASEQKRVAAMQSEIEKRMSIIIGGGGITTADGSVYNNVTCLESVSESLENGNSVFELFFYESSDGRLLCTRPNSEYEEYVYGMPLLLEGITESEFLSGRIYDQFTPIALDQVIELMNEYPDAYIITNIQTDNCSGLSIIARDYSQYMGRIIPQVFDTEEYEVVRNLGFQSIILSLDRYEEEEVNPFTISEFIETHDVMAVSLRENLIDYRPILFSEIINTMVPVYVHPVDEPDIVKRDLEKGVKAFYTNNNSLSECIDYE